MYCNPYDDFFLPSLHLICVEQTEQILNVLSTMYVYNVYLYNADPTQSCMHRYLFGRLNIEKESMKSLETMPELQCGQNLGSGIPYT